MKVERTDRLVGPGRMCRRMAHQSYIHWRSLRKGDASTLAEFVCPYLSSSHPDTDHWINIQQTEDWYSEKHHRRKTMVTLYDKGRYQAW
jgi:hypothetical protein